MGCDWNSLRKTVCWITRRRGWVCVGVKGYFSRRFGVGRRSIRMNCVAIYGARRRWNRAHFSGENMGRESLSWTVRKTQVQLESQKTRRDLGPSHKVTQANLKLKVKDPQYLSHFWTVLLHPACYKMRPLFFYSIFTPHYILTLMVCRALFMFYLVNCKGV